MVAVASSVLPAPRQDGLRTGGSGREWLSRATISSCSSIDGATRGDELSGAAAYAAICSHSSIEQTSISSPLSISYDIFLQFMH